MNEPSRPSTRRLLRRPPGWRKGLLLAALILGLLLAMPLLARGGNDLFIPRPDGAAADVTAPTLRSRAVDVNWAALSPAARQIRLSPFAGVTLTATRQRVDHSVSGGFVWVGSLAEEPGGTVTLSVQDGALAGSVFRGGQEWLVIRPLSGGGHVVYEVDPTAPEPNGNDVAWPSPGGGASSPSAPQDAACQDDGSVIDILVTYTPAARDATGGEAAIIALINQRVSDMNTANIASAAPFQWRLAGTMAVDYTESGNVSSDLSALQSTTDGVMDGVHIMRDAVRADLVTLLIAEGNNNACGMAYQMMELSPDFEDDAFGVTALDYPGDAFCTSLTFAHELGHNMGNAHDRDHAPATVLTPYSYGHQSPTGLFRDIMSYDCPGGCPRLNFWANPEVWYLGEPTGVDYETDPANAADIVRSMNDTRQTAANFRNACVAATPTPTASPTPTTTPTTTASPTPSDTPTLVNTPTPTRTPTTTPTPTLTSTPTRTPTPENTSAPTRTPRPTRRPTRTRRPTATPEPTTWRAFVPTILR